MRFLLILLLLVGPLRADETIDKIYDHIRDGDLASARERYQELPAMTVRDANRLFVAALLEADGAAARDLLKTAVALDLDGRYRQEAAFRLIQLAAAAGDTAAVIQQGTEFLYRWETSDFRARLLAILAAFSRDGSSEQKRYLGFLEDQYPGDYFGQFARLTKAEQAFNAAQYKTATTLCRRVNNAADGNLDAVSMILLSRIALQNREYERALFNYNILEEKYGHAIGQDELLSALRRSAEGENPAEPPGPAVTSYAVQVGVFSMKDNARSMAERVEEYGYVSDIRAREISGKTYHVVSAGRFESLNDAQAARKRLEQGENEIFKVVIVDD